MKDPLGVSPSKGNQGTTRGKGRSNMEVVGSIPTEVKGIFHFRVGDNFGVGIISGAVQKSS